MRLTRRDWALLLLLWLGGINMRLTMLAIPPLVPLIHHDLHLDETGVGALVSLPVLLLAIAAIPGSLLIARLGVRGALAAGLAAIALFGALRGLGPSTPVLFGATFLMGVGVAVSQPAFPSLVRDWFPGKIAIAAAAYSNGVLIGETTPTVFTTPIGVLQLAGGDWRWALVPWSVIVLVTGVAIVLAAPRWHAGVPAPQRWWPNWRQGQTIRVGVVMGMASAVYFATNAYIPDFFVQTGRANLVGPALAVLNASQLLSSPTVAIWPRIVAGRTGFVAAAALMAAAQVGILITPGTAVILWTFVLGFSTAIAFIVVLTLPPRLAAPADVPRMSAGIFTFQYAVAFSLPLVAGALWDFTGTAVLAFVPGLAAAGLMALMALQLRIPSAERLTDAPGAST